MTDNEFHVLLALLEKHTRTVLGAAEKIAPLQRIRAASDSGAASEIGANHEEHAALYNLQSFDGVYIERNRSAQDRSAICNCPRELPQ